MYEQSRFDPANMLSQSYDQLAGLNSQTLGAGEQGMSQFYDSLGPATDFSQYRNPMLAGFDNVTAGLLNANQNTQNLWDNSPGATQFLTPADRVRQQTASVLAKRQQTPCWGERKC